MQNNPSTNNDERMSFVTVSSFFDVGEDKAIQLKEEQNEQDKINSNKQQHNLKGVPQENLIQMEIKGSFEDLPLQMSTCGDKTKMKLIIPYLLVEDRGEKQGYIGKYKSYEISLINEKNEKRILCYRRYDNFDSFFNHIKKKFPSFVYPKLSEKNVMTKIINDCEFFNKRRRQLNYFINICFTHSKLKDTREFYKFINDPEFDENYFKKESKIYSFPESEKFRDTVSTKIYGVFTTFSSYFGSSASDEVQSDIGIHLKKMEMFYKKLTENFRELKTNLIVYVNTLKKASENFGEISNNFFYLKDAIFEAQSTREYYTRHYKISSELSSVNKSIYEDQGNAIIDRIDGFLSVLHGICEAFERYTEFIKVYQMVNKANINAKINAASYDLVKLFQELSAADAIKTNFERVLIEEIKSYAKKYNNEYVEIMQSYNQIINSINECEMVKMGAYTNYFK